MGGPLENMHYMQAFDMTICYTSPTYRSGDMPLMDQMINRRSCSVLGIDLLGGIRLSLLYLPTVGPIRSLSNEKRGRKRRRGSNVPRRLSLSLFQASKHAIDWSIICNLIIPIEPPCATISIIYDQSLAKQVV